MFEILPCFTPLEMEQLGLGENGLYVSNSRFDSRIFFDYYKENNCIEDPEKYVKMLSEVYEDFVKEPSDINSQRLLELGWNPEVRFNPSTLNTVSQLTRKRLDRIEIVDLTESDDLLDTVEDSLIIAAHKAIDIIRTIPLGDLPEIFGELDPFRMTENGTLLFYKYGLKEDNEDADKLLGVIDKVNKDLVNSGNQYILIKKIEMEKNLIPRYGELEMEYFMAAGYNPYVHMDFMESTHAAHTAYSRSEDDKVASNGDANVITSYEIKDEEEPEE